MFAQSPTSPERADYSGTWELNAQLSEDPVEKWMRGGEGGKKGSDPGGVPGGGGGRGGPGTGSVSELSGIPTELLENNRRLVIVDRGTSIRFSRRAGEERALSLDGQELELDFGAGPVKVKAVRRGGAGEKILVSMAWHSGKKVKETWELATSPRRLSVVTEIPGRHPIVYRRIYDPAPDRPAETAVTTARTPAPFQTPAETPGTAVAHQQPAATPGQRPECSIKPRSGTPQGELSRLARISVSQAAEKATAAVAPKKPNSVISSEVEVYDGCLVFTFLLRFDGQKGFQEVVIDAGDGKVLSSQFESQ